MLGQRLRLWPVIKPTLAQVFTRPAPVAHSYRMGLVTQMYQDLISVGPDICHRGCAYTVVQTVQRPGVFTLSLCWVNAQN